MLTLQRPDGPEAGSGMMKVNVSVTQSNDLQRYRVCLQSGLQNGM